MLLRVPIVFALSCLVAALTVAAQAQDRIGQEIRTSQEYGLVYNSITGPGYSQSSLTPNAT